MDKPTPPDPDIDDGSFEFAYPPHSESEYHLGFVDSFEMVAQARRFGWTAEDMERIYPHLPLKLCRHMLMGRVVLDGRGYVKNTH